MKNENGKNNKTKQNMRKLKRILIKFSYILLKQKNFHFCVHIAMKILVLYGKHYFLVYLSLKEMVSQFRKPCEGKSIGRPIYMNEPFSVLSKIDSFFFFVSSCAYFSFVYFSFLKQIVIVLVDFVKNIFFEGSQRTESTGRVLNLF